MHEGVEDVSYRIPYGETICVTYSNQSGKDMFLLTTKRNTDLFYLYEITENGIQKLGKDQSPFVLESKFKVNERILK